MTTKELNSTTMTTTMITASTFTSSPKLDVEAEDDEEPPTMIDPADMDLVNGPNPWLPAYGFQLQHRSHFQPTHEDLRTNDTVLVQQVDFLETILEETSDDLQSDSDRSGTTYWVGSDSETESVIHIRAKQRSADERLDGSGSECNSVVPKKRRRKYNSTSDREHQVIFDDYPPSPRSSRSSASSRSSSLLQFESLERTCATLSPSSYSFDSLEYPNRSISHPENTSPDSLEQDYEKNLPNGFATKTVDHFSRIRPYRSFESLDTCQKEEEYGHGGLTNGFTPLYLKRNADLSRTRNNGYYRPRDFWHEDDEYEDDECDDDLDEEDHRLLNDNRIGSELEDRLVVFGDSACNYATSLDYRNTIDLREIGIESKRDTLLDLKSGQAAVSSSFRLLQTRLNITGNMAHSRNNMVADHHHYHHQPQQQLHGFEQHELRQHQQHQGWSKEECFNFRFTDKSQSAPSLPSSVTESVHDPCLLASYASSSRATSFVSTSNLFENYTRVASVPVDLNLCGTYATHDDTCCFQISLHESESHEMAEVTNIQEKTRLESGEEIRQNDGEEDVELKNILMSSVRTQASQNVMVDDKMDREKAEEEQEDGEDCVGEHFSKSREKKQVTSTVKTQDRGNCVLDMAIRMENDIDGAVDDVIKQFKREVEEATSNGNIAALSGIDSIQRTSSGKQRPRKVKNNASYELAQQFEIDERSFRPNRFRKEIASDSEKPLRSVCSGRKRVLNNASYELAQQCDYIKALQSSRGAFQRMDACDELEESLSGRSSQLRISDMVQQMSSNSTSNLSNYQYNEPHLDTRRSKSSENIYKQFSMAPFTRIPINQLGQRLKKEQDESLLSQIKKNSDPFSAYGDDPSARALVDDEIDFPCLETKPIETSSPEGGVSEETSAQKPQEPIALEHENLKSDTLHVITISDNTAVLKDTDQNKTEETSNSKKSFIGDFYPEKIERLQQPGTGSKDPTNELESEGSDDKNESPSTSQLSTSSCNSRNTGELLWRVIVEKQAAERETSMEKVMEEEKNQQKVENEREKVGEEREEEEAAEAARGHTVHGVRSPPLGSSSNSDGLEPSERSGNPAVAVAVDTNHRGARDKRHEENAAATTAAVRVDDEHDGHATMSATTTTTTTTKARPFVTAPLAKTDSSTKFQRNVVVDASSAIAVKEERKKGGLGGFLQRFSRLRFSGRSKVPRSEVQKKSDIGQVNRAKVTEEKIRKEPDYIIIPLHPPEEEKQKQEQNVTVENRMDTSKDRAVAEVQRSSSTISANGRAPVSSKPPLPPQPPRVVALGSKASTGASAACLSRRRAATDLGNPAAIEMAKARAMQAAQERPVGLLETDLDEAVPSSTTTTVAASASANAAGKKTRSLLNLNHTSTAPRPRPEHALHVPQSPVATSHRSSRDDDAASTINQRPHKSMEFLLDKENLHFVKPPENELQKVGERVPSEHELRVQRSLQRLNVPDWYKNSPAARDGFRLKRHSDASQHGGWRALGSKTTSLSSLSSSSNRQPTTGALLSPSPTPPVFSRWSTSLLNSAGSSPASSARSSFNHRQPYLGWRSQERLTNPRTPAERLAQGILPQLQAANKQQQQQQQQQQTTNQQLEVRNSIKEVTSAIVHYVQSGQEVGGGGRLSPRSRPEDWDDRGGARSTSPRGSVKLCWMESSFVGTRPVDSPETPMSLATETDCCPGCNATATESCSCVDSATSGLFLDLTPTRDDSQQQPGGGGSLCLSPSSSLNYHHHHRQLHQQQPQQQQRHHRGELLLA